MTGRNDRADGGRADGPEPHRCGYIGLLGRSNVGKSTLMNRIVGRKLGVVSAKPQTTRWSLLGIKSTPSAQLLFMDTPGLQKQPRQLLNRSMNRDLAAAAGAVDVSVLVVAALRWQEMDEQSLRLVVRHGKPALLVVNKIDRVADRGALLAYLREAAGRYSFRAVLPVSALRGKNLARLERALVQSLPVAPARYPEGQHSDREQRFFAAEFLREQLMRRLHRELPYQLSVSIEEFHSQGAVLHVRAVIWVARRSQRRIVIGQGGRVLKAAGRAARRDMEAMFQRRIYLTTWVKVQAAAPESVASSRAPQPPYR